MYWCQKRVYTDQQDPLMSFSVRAVKIAFGIQEAVWTSHEHPFLEVRSMPQASLTEYFVKHYKGGGVFEHDAYEHVPNDEWCWIHKSSGIKARPL